MNEEQIKQNADAYISNTIPLCDALYESVARNAYIAGANSRDEEVEQLRKALSSAQKAMAELAELYNKKGE